ncbi:ATP-binding protein [Streptomyces sp. NBC_01463]
MLTTETAVQTSTGPRAVRIGLDMAVGRTSADSTSGLSAAEAVWPRRFRRIIRASLKAWGHPYLTEAAELLISEIVTNAFQHGRGDIRVRLYFSVSHFVIEVADGNPAAPEVRPVNPDAEDGRGLHLVDALAAAWGVSNDGTCTWCTLPLRRGLPDAPRPATITSGAQSRTAAARLRPVPHERLPARQESGRSAT